MSQIDCARRERGFMLTDAIVALFVLSSVSVSLVAGFRLASGEAHASATMASALLVGQACMEMTGIRSETSVVPSKSGDFTQQRGVTVIPKRLLSWCSWSVSDAWFRGALVRKTSARLCWRELMSRKTPRDSGFSLTEAIVALLVLSLAMSQLPNLMSLFSGAYRETIESVRLAKDFAGVVARTVTNQPIHVQRRYRSRRRSPWYRITSVSPSLSVRYSRAALPVTCALGQVRPRRVRLVGGPTRLHTAVFRSSRE